MLNLPSYSSIDNWVLRPTSRVLCSNGLSFSPEPLFSHEKRGVIAPERNPVAKPILQSKIAEERLRGHPLGNPAYLFSRTIYWYGMYAVILNGAREEVGAC